MKDVLRAAIVIVCVAAPATALAQGVPRTLTVQGILRDTEGVPVEQVTSFRFELLDGTRVAWEEEHSVEPRAGLFTITLGTGTPLEPSMFAARLTMRMTIGGETMDPIPLSSVPYAMRAEMADAYDGDVSWGQLTDLPPGFADGTDDGGDPTVVQSRISGTCPAGQSIRAISEDGTVTCEIDDVGATGTTYSAGTGLTLTGSQFDVDTNMIQSRVSGMCPMGQAIRVINANGSVVCEMDDVYSAGGGLALMGTVFSVDTNAIQARVTGMCPPGQAIRLIASDGMVTCEPTGTAYMAAGGLLLMGTTFSVDTGAIQARVTGACPGSAIQSIAANGTVTCMASAGGDPTPDTIADDDLIVDSEASNNLSISNGLLVALAGGTRADVNGELTSDGLRQIGPASPTAYEVSERRYIVDAPPSSVGVVVALDPAIVDPLCRDADGCDLTVAMVNWAPAAEPGNVASRRERLFISETSRWWRIANNDVEGPDGTGTHEWTPWDCFFTDAETTMGSSNQRGDVVPGFGLLNVAGGSYPDATTTCRIIIED